MEEYSGGGAEREGEGEFRCMNIQVEEYLGLGAFRGRRIF